MKNKVWLFEFVLYNTPMVAMYIAKTKQKAIKKFYRRYTESAVIKHISERKL